MRADHLQLPYHQADKKQQFYITCCNSIYNSKEMKLKKVILGHDAEVSSVHFSPMSGRLFASASRDRLVHVCDAMSNYSLTRTLNHHSSAVSAVRFSRDDSKLITAAGDRSIVMSDISEGSPDSDGSLGSVSIVRYKTISVASTVKDMTVEATNRNLVAGGQGRKIGVWNLTTGKASRS